MNRFFSFREVLCVVGYAVLVGVYAPHAVGIFTGYLLLLLGRLWPDE